MTTDVYDVGDEIELRSAFTDIDGDPADPTTVALSILKPDGTVITVDEGMLAHDEDEPGVYTYPVLIDQSGIWAFRFAGTGDVTAAEELAFRVRRRRVPASSE